MDFMEFHLGRTFVFQAYFGPIKYQIINPTRGNTRTITPQRTFTGSGAADLMIVIIA